MYLNKGSTACLVLHVVVSGLDSAKNVVRCKEFGSACNKKYLG